MYTMLSNAIQFKNSIPIKNDTFVMFIIISLVYYLFGVPLIHSVLGKIFILFSTVTY